MFCSLPKKKIVKNYLSRIITIPSWKDKTRTCLTNLNKFGVFSTIHFDFWISKGHMICLFYTMRKWGDFQLIFRITMTICNSFPIHYNSTYFYGCDCYWTSYMNCNGYNSLMWKCINMQFMLLCNPNATNFQLP